MKNENFQLDFWNLGIFGGYICKALKKSYKKVKLKIKKKFMLKLTNRKKIADLNI